MEQSDLERHDTANIHEHPGVLDTPVAHSYGKLTNSSNSSEGPDNGGAEDGAISDMSLNSRRNGQQDCGESASEDEVVFREHRMHTHRQERSNNLSNGHTSDYYTVGSATVKDECAPRGKIRPFSGELEDVDRYVEDRISDMMAQFRFSQEQTSKQMKGMQEFWERTLDTTRKEFRDIVKNNNTLMSKLNDRIAENNDLMAKCKDYEDMIAWPDENNTCPFTWTVQIMEAMPDASSPEFSTPDGYRMQLKVVAGFLKLFLVPSEDDDALTWPWDGKEVLSVKTKCNKSTKARRDTLNLDVNIKDAASIASTQRPQEGTAQDSLYYIKLKPGKTYIVNVA